MSDQNPRAVRRLSDIVQAAGPIDRNEIEREVLRTLYGGALRQMGEDYARDRNPLRAWAAYRLSANNGLPVPGWVHEYLDAAAEALLAQVDNPPKRTPEAVVQSLGFDVHAPFRSYQIEGRDIEIYLFVEELVAGGEEPGKAIGRAERKFSPSRDTVRNIRSKMKRRIERD